MERTSLIVGLVLVIVGSLLFIGSLTLTPGWCPPGLLVAESICEDLRRSQFFTSWFLGASSFALALVILFAGERRKLSLQQVLGIVCLMYGVLPLGLFLMMVFTGLWGTMLTSQVIIAYYLLALVSGLIVLFSRVNEVRTLSKEQAVQHTR